MPLRRSGASIVVPDAEFDGDRLTMEVAQLFDDSARRSGMAVAMREWARPKAADRAAELLSAFAPNAQRLSGGGNEEQPDRGVQ